MVSFKRKPVQYVPVPPVIDSDEVWLIPKTGEVFTEYELYLQRREFYNQRKFTCDITGHSGLTFYEALDSENAGSQEIDVNFPEPLRGPVLRKVQFSQISRIDELVTYAYESFKDEFFPGEHVIATLDDGERAEGVIREKVNFPELRSPDGSIARPALSHYFVKLGAFPNEQEAFMDNRHLSRGRKVFTKQTLRPFLKNALERENWSGAPWRVKDKLALDYKIDSDIPPHLRQEAVQAERKANADLKKDQQGQGTFYNFIAGHRPLEIKPGLKGFSNGLTLQDMAAGQSSQLSTTPGSQAARSAQHANNFRTTVFQPVSTMAPPPRPPKYPIDDLELPLKKDEVQRPALKFMTVDTPSKKVEISGGAHGIEMRSMGSLLEIWNTLNVHVEVFLLDSFTLDDLIDAMAFSSEDVDCELFVEMHCAVLKQLVNEGGDLQVTLPDLPVEMEEPESPEDTSTATTPAPEPEPARTTRSSLARAEAAALKRRSPSEPRQLHRASEMLADYGWIDRLKARDFTDGGWEVIMVGLLQQLSLNPRHKEQCEDILSHLAPVDQEPTQETARQQYRTLDVNLRITALQLITTLAVGTKAIRNYLETMSEEMTRLRKEKIEHQRARKPMLEELRELDESRRLLLPENMPASPPAETNGSPDVIMADVNGMDEDDGSSNDPDDEEPVPSRSLRRASDRTSSKRKREEEEARKEREKKEKEAEKTSKQSAQFKKLLRDIEKKKEKIRECEERIADLDNDLREANCQRTKVLGRDRFCNRYYWFERNGMPFAGLPSSSTSDRGYANGRIWVQGPDDLERVGYLELPPKDAAKYCEVYGVGIPERRKIEEGPTSLSDSHQWGCYDDPDALDQLIGWLDDRGVRERGLRKELQNWREKITEYMLKMKTYLDEVEQKKDDEEEMPIRVSTRHKTYVDLDKTDHHCLEWRNNYAIDHQGHLHSEQPQPKSKKNSRKSAEAKSSAKASLPKIANPTTRRGTQYNKL